MKNFREHFQITGTNTIAEQGNNIIPPTQWIEEILVKPNGNFIGLHTDLDTRRYKGMNISVGRIDFKGIKGFIIATKEPNAILAKFSHSLGEPLAGYDPSKRGPQIHQAVHQIGSYLDNSGGEKNSVSNISLIERYTSKPINENSEKILKEICRILNEQPRINKTVKKTWKAYEKQDRFETDLKSLSIGAKIRRFLSGNRRGN